MLRRVLVVLAGLSFCPEAGATPSSTLWTNCSIDVQPCRVGHVTYDNYTTLGRKGPLRGGGQFANDLGLTVGILPSTNLQMEVGFDWIEPTDHPISFNAKIGWPEGGLSRGSPALQLGVFNAGTKRGVTDQAIVHLITGRSLPEGLGRIHLSGYFGNAQLLRSSAGERDFPSGRPGLVQRRGVERRVEMDDPARSQLPPMSQTGSALEHPWRFD